jgi:hypothetical protein
VLAAAARQHLLVAPPGTEPTVMDGLRKEVQ